MSDFLWAIARRLWPQQGELDEQRRLGATLNVFSILYLGPVAVGGLIWLVLVTDLTLVGQEWPVFLAIFVLIFLFRRLDFFVLLELRPGRYAEARQTVESIVIWGGILLFGPSVLWLNIAWALADQVYDHLRQTPTGERWGRVSTLVTELALTASYLAAVTLYTRWGGVFPLPSLILDHALPAVAAILAHYVLSRLLFLPLIFYFAWGSLMLMHERVASRGALARFVVVLWLVPQAMDVFGVLAAGLYSMVGWWAALFFISNILFGSFLSAQLSRAIEHSRQRSRELEQLERLARAIIRAPADASTLPDLLGDYIPGMFPPGSRVEIRLYPDQTLVHYPDDWPSVDERVWMWLQETGEARHFSPKDALPWKARPGGSPIVAAPIICAERGEPIGGIYLERVSTLSTTHQAAELLPAIQSLSAQIATTLLSAENYNKALANQRAVQELALAGEIQASFLPDAVPEIPGWQLAATLEPARETSGDFFDVIPLPNNRWGLVVADVADKGLGAALYMALSRTLIRTYAVQHDTHPDRALAAANQRILEDTYTSLFVTVFYAILDPVSGTLSYCNAGHNPGYLLSGHNGGSVRTLPHTGIPLGLFADKPWTRRTIQLAAGETLVLYTDGITEAQDEAQAMFGEERLIQATLANAGCPAHDIQEALLENVRTFVGSAPQHDDMTLLVLVRDS